MTTCCIKDRSFQGITAPRKSKELTVMCIAEYKFGAADSRGEEKSRQRGGEGWIARGYNTKDMHGRAAIKTITENRISAICSFRAVRARPHDALQ
jgi:hypothetical protein